MIDTFIEKLKFFAINESSIECLLVVGSYARGANTPHSDLDLVFITKSKEYLLNNQSFLQNFGKITKKQIEFYGVCTSIRVWYEDGPEVEFGIVDSSWLSIPLDSGTEKVLKDGYKVVIDKTGFFDDSLDIEYL